MNENSEDMGIPRKVKRFMYKSKRQTYYRFTKKINNSCKNLRNESQKILDFYEGV